MKYETICSRLESKERRRDQLNAEIVQLQQMKLQMERTRELKRLKELEKLTLTRDEAEKVQAQYNKDEEGGEKQ